MQHVLKMNLDKFKKQVEELEKIVSQTSIKKLNYTLSQPMTKNAFQLIRLKDYVVDLNFGTASFAHGDNRVNKNQLANLIKANSIIYINNANNIYTRPGLIPLSNYKNLHDIYIQGEIFSLKNDPIFSNHAMISIKDLPRDYSNFWCFVDNPASATCFVQNQNLADIITLNKNRLSFSIKSIDVPELEDEEVVLTVVITPTFLPNQGNVIFKPDLAIMIKDRWFFHPS